jgi:50S ribosomal subunit-associated GTPase HflX
MAPLYFKNAEAIILVLDGSDPDCLKSSTSLLARYKGDISSETINFIAVNKIDLVPGLDASPKLLFVKSTASHIC